MSRERKIVSTKYKQAMSEVLGVLKLCDEQVISKIPLETIKNLKENAIEVEGLEEKFEKYHDDISILDLSQEAVAMLAAIYRKYLCTDKQREAFDKHLLNAEEILQDCVDFNNVFKKEESGLESNSTTSQSLPIDINKKTSISKFFNAIKKWFKKC